ncbi:MAG TPA: phosphoserine aminotransferase, partial [Alphaproteobacteria bacterium]|nr:phosphoserine aminotransferase [Alphaproteobacteria bacterium]
IGGLKTTIARSAENFKVIENWVAKTEWADFLCDKPEARSFTSVCLKITDPWFADLKDQQAFIKALTKLLETEKVAYDIAGYRDAPAGLRIWCGATVQGSDIEALMPWIDWAYQTAKLEEMKKLAA